jgi:hypothetical protein
MSTYNPFTGSATGVTNGRGVPRCHLNKRLDLAACAVLGWAPLKPSITQAVPAFRVPYAALKERIDCFRALEANGNGHAVVEDHTVSEIEQADNSGAVRCEFIHFLVAALQDASPEELIEVARRLGIDWCWDRLIAPNVQSDRNS